MINSDYLKNNVDPENQAKHSYSLGSINKENSFRVLFLGNSITYHEAKGEIGWFHNSGMAASKADNDYVHLVYEGLKTKLNRDVTALISGISYFEVDYSNKNNKKTIIKIAKDFNPDLIIFNIGENVKNRNEHLKEIEYHFNDIIGKLIKECTSLLIVNLFWRDDSFNKVFEKIAKKYEIELVDISDIGDDDKNKAIGLFSHQGVSVHPGDLGMKKIADRILEKFK